LKSQAEIYERVVELAHNLASHAVNAAATVDTPDSQAHDEAAHFTKVRSDEITTLLTLLGKSRESITRFVNAEERAGEQFARENNGHMLEFSLMRLRCLKWVLDAE
jgi:hypothetical protein